MLDADSDAFLASTQVTDALNPTNLMIRNDSHLHSHHKAMVGSTSKETHF
jgi:BolA protein